MINRYSDHAANERTFLAWVRTAIAVMAFGFLIERFDLVLRFAVKATGDASIPIHRQASDLGGLLFILMGIGMMIVAAIRFRHIGQEIDRRSDQKVYSERVDF